MQLPKIDPLKPIALPDLKPIGTDSVSKKPTLQEWHAAGGGVPLQYKGREHVWHAKVDKFAAGGEAHMGAGGVLKKMIKSATEAPTIIIPSKVSSVKEAVRQSKGDYGARRVERAADEIPNLERLYKEEALKRAFEGDNAKAMMTLNPARFEEFATPIGSTFTRPNSVRRTSTGEQVTFPEYLEHLRTVDGFNDVPFLEINKQRQGTEATPFISNHEGRHRNRAMAQSGETSGLVQLLPRSELREPFPRRSQEDYIEALKKELEMTGNVVLPQINSNQPHLPQRRAIKLPDVYAAGGEVHMAGGGDPRGEMKAYDPTIRERMADALQRGMEGLGGSRYKARQNAQTLMGGPSSNLPINMGIADIIPFLGTALGVDEGARDLGHAYDAVKRGDYIDAAANTVGAAAGLIPGAVGTIKGAKAVGRGALDLAKSDAAYNLAQKALASPALAAARPMYVVKPTGGNFLTGRTEKDLKPLKRYDSPTPDEKLWIQEKQKELMAQPDSERKTRGLRAIDADIASQNRNEALNKWVDSNLTNYVKKQMGTPDDPVRKMAEEGITHKPGLVDEYQRTEEALKKQRMEAGFPEEGMGQSPTAQAWERASDEAIATHRAGDIQEMPERYAKLQEAEEKMRTAREAVDKKFKQQMKNAGIEDPENSIHYGITPTEKAKIVGDTDLAKASLEYRLLQSPMMESYMTLGRENPWISKVDPETRVYRPFTGDLGFDHIMDVLREDLTAGRIRPEQMNKISITDAVRRTYQYDQELAAKMNAARAAAREGLPVHKEYPEGYKWIELNKPGAFAQESEAMGHSVRGYEPPKGHPDWTEGSGTSGSSSYGHGGWEAIKSGKAKVYSLVDPKGAPHATVEVGQNKNLDFNKWWEQQTPEKRAEINRRAQQGEHNMSVFEAPEYLAARAALPPRITQIKGKQNRAPNEEYLPYIQDFVKSGKWSDIGDLQNTGLRRTSDAFNETEQAFLRSKGVELKPYIEPEEAARYQEMFKRTPDAEPGFAAGGAAKKVVEGAVKGVKKLLGAADEVPKGAETIGKLEEAMKTKQAPMVAPQGTGLPLMPRSQGMYTPGVKQEDLPRMPKVDKARAEGKQPAYTERMQDLLDSPTVRKKVDKLINQGKDLNVQEWYGTEPLRQVAMDAGLSPDEFKTLIAQLASASQRNPVDQQNRMGSYLHYLSRTGQLPEDAFLLTNKIKRGKQEMPKGTPIELPPSYGSLAQGDIFERGKQIASGDIMGALPPDKKLGTFYRNYLGNLKPVTVDVNAVRGPIIERGDPRWLTSKLVEKDEEGNIIATHFPRRDVAEGRMSLKEAKERPGFWEAAPSGSEYAGFEDLWQRGARRHGIEPAEAQALGWYGSADVTALKTKPELYIDNLERMIKRTAEQTGQHPLQVMDDLIKGKGFLYKKGGSVHMPDNKSDTAKPTTVGKKPKHKRGGLPPIK